RAATGWYCAGPVVLLWSAGLHAPVLSRWPFLVAALGAQFSCDAAAALVRCWSMKVSPRRLIEPLVFTFSVDALLAPLALCAVLASHDWPALVVFPLLPVALLRILSVDRNRRLNTALTLGKELKSIRDESRTDAMTGLANRRAWEEVVARAERAAADRHQREVTTVVLMADVDYLKAVNDNFGHDAGDELLRTYAAVLSDTAPEGAFVARLGGDEFGVIFQTATEDARAIHDFTFRLRNAMASRRTTGGTRVSASLGIASCPAARTIAEAILLADLGAGNDKEARRVQRGSMASQLGDMVASLGAEDFAVLCRQLSHNGRARLLEGLERGRERAAHELLVALRQAMARQELFVVYQPLFSLGDRSVRGAEALVRWQDPQRGVVLPGEFIPAAEESGLVSAIDAFVLEEACSQLAAWLREEVETSGLTMSVNLSGRGLCDDGLADRVISSIERNGLEPSQICLEVTETALVDDLEHAGSILGRLSGYGVRLALDDFGTRYSMLAHLQRLNVNVLKVDRSFVAGIGSSERDRKIVGSLTGMAHELGMSVVGEGIETEQQLDVLARLGCDEGQGFLLAHPLPPEEFSNLRRRELSLLGL
ncbi:MAG TPA: bifunctional diguanylate cyclase/phosphodiesterase, partial [Acidimicrobiales bacterium]|nr:bifunctional diguanylate cyclase/phosphodiesterase [Acidimicrobiales bacterium]